MAPSHQLPLSDAARADDPSVDGHGRAMRGPEMRGVLQRLADEFDELAIPAHGRYVPADKGLSSSSE